MAQTILAGMLARAGIDAEVTSAGLLEGGRPMTPEAIHAVTGDGPDMSGHRSRSLNAAAVSGSDLILAMTREHVREVTVLVPEAWTYTFTLKELVRRGEAHGPRGADQPLPDWLSEVSVHRQRSELLGMSMVDDIADPMGGPPSRFAKTAAELRDLCRRLVDVLCA
jgi:protein-tyrosine phosphatase